ncbi:c-type cytochrome [Luteimonas sp. 50]|uniref:C-type cytochrome n=1 Tax=Cognatiluteimonas sedimenti TaxID=2927791 RepID=A0ABT0A1E9_9GAMM|nr:c-type cytochrome [Lysobacter sedimenti]MCJ0824801.1 c-type cytochrome [Lysobacter sedimenti]
MKNHQRHLLAAGIAIGVLAIGIGGFVWSGLYNIGADDPHWAPTRMLIDNLREHSIGARMVDVAVPNLEDPQRIRLGAVNYSAMCTGCHLAPGVEDTEIRPGLYPMPPNLTTLANQDPKRSFWIIKHGIKMSAMPAWGKTHTDDQIWDMVAFLQKLPGMTPTQYAALGGKPPAEDEDHMHAGMEDEHAGGGESHGESEQDGHAHEAGDAGHEASDPAASTISMAGLAANAVPAAESAAKAFHEALKRGDRQVVLALLAPEVVIHEGGETQSREAYAASHLNHDIAFLKDADIRPVDIGSMAMGDTAMVGSRSQVRTTHHGEPVAVLSSEMLTLKKAPNGWLITQVDWVSQPLQP